MARPPGSALCAQVTKKLTTQVMSAIKALAVVDQANQLGRLLPPEAFYNELIRCPLARPAAPGITWTSIFAQLAADLA